jgi:DNA-binding CsgD family transcriptional regulator
MLNGGYMSVLQASSREQFREELVRFTHELGFETVSAITVVDHSLRDSEFISVDNTPQAYLDAYDDTSRASADPVMQHCRRSSVPLVWDQDTYTAMGLGAKWEHQAHFGYRTGIILALHLPEGRHFILGVDRDKQLPEDRSEVTRIVADLQLFAVCAQEAAARVFLPVVPGPDQPRLSPRELESLRWTMEGKTAWETGQILGISERTAVLHINNAMHKLGCVNKHQAVLRALKLGLIR